MKVISLHVILLVSTLFSWHSFEPNLFIYLQISTAADVHTWCARTIGRETNVTSISMYKQAVKQQLKQANIDHKTKYYTH